MKKNLGSKLSYGILDLGQNAFLNLVGFYFLFYMTDVIRISPALAGLALLIGKVWDAVTDPVVGHWSDRTVSRWGRRRPYMGAGSISIAVFIFAMFSVPDFSAESARFAYVTIFYVLASTSFTLMNIPYQALLPELTSDFDERTSFVAWRMGFAVIGTFIGAGAVGALVDSFPGNGWSMTALIIGLLAGATGLITVLSVREPAHRVQEEPLGFLGSLVHVLGQKPFLLAVLPWTLFNLGVTVVQSSLVYYFSYIMGDAGLFNLGVFALLGAALLAIPLYVGLSRFLDKKGSYLVGIGLMVVMLFVFTYASPLFPPVISVILMGAAGLGLGAHYVMPHSILPDVIEWDAVTTGTRREGVFASMWTFSVKIGQALALGLSGLVLDISGYRPEGIQTGSALSGIRLLTGVIPALILVSGMVILAFYPISRKYYESRVHHSGEKE